MELLDKDFQGFPSSLLEVDFLLSSDVAAAGVFVPLNAIIFEAGQPYVFILDQAESTVQRVAVGLGKYLGDSVMIQEGIEKGTLVAIEGHKFLKDGEKVEVKQA